MQLLASKHFHEFTKNFLSTIQQKSLLSQLLSTKNLLIALHALHAPRVLGICTRQLSIHVIEHPAKVSLLFKLFTTSANLYGMFRCVVEVTRLHRLEPNVLWIYEYFYFNWSSALYPIVKNKNETFIGHDSFQLKRAAVECAINRIGTKDSRPLQQLGFQVISHTLN